MAHFGDASAMKRRFIPTMSASQKWRCGKLFRAMASEEEDLLDDGNFKDLGELDDLDDEEENALLGDSDEEGANRVRDKSRSLMSSASNHRQIYSGDDEDADVEEGQEQEFEYVDEEGNPVDIDANDDVEYVEVSQGDTGDTGLEESTNEFVLDLVVDADLEFDDSGVQEIGDKTISSSSTKPKARKSLPPVVQKQQQKEDKRKQPQQQKAAQVKLESQRQNNYKQQQQVNRRQQLQQRKRDDQQRRHEQQQQQQREQQEQRNKEQQEQQRIQQQRTLRQQKQQQFVNIRGGSVDNEKSMENEEEHNFIKQEDSYDSSADNEGDQQYNTSVKNESSESEDEEESGRGRFRTERPNVISVSTAKKRPNIPDSLEAVISHEEAARLERSNRLQAKRPWQRRGSAREMPRDRERDKNRDRDRDKGRNREHDRIHKDGSLLSRQQEIGHGNLVHFQQHSDSVNPSCQDSDSSSNPEQKASRKILINPHFKGSIIPSSEVLPDPGYSSWNNQAAHFPNPSNHSSTVSSEQQYMPHQTAPEGQFGASFGVQPPSRSLLNPQNSSQNSLGQYPYTQPPPVKHNAPFHVPPPTMPDFQSRPPPLMSIPPLIPPANNHHGQSVNLFPPPREQSVPRELPQVQFQTGNDSWTQNINQHNFKPYNVPPPNQSFPPVLQNNEQPPPSFPNVQQPPPPIPHTEFQHQLAPPAGPPPSFNRPPPGFDINVRLGGPPPSRPMLSTWPTQQQQQRPHPPMVLPVFNRPPPPSSMASHPNNFQVMNMPPTPLPMVRPTHSTMNESNLGNIGQFSQLGINLRQPFAPAGQNTNLRSLPQQQQQQQRQQQQQQHHHHQQQQQQLPHLQQHQQRQQLQHQQSWSSSNLRPIAQQQQHLFGKRPSNEAISASPLKQIRIANKPLPINRHIPPQVNTNIRQVEIVDKLPTVDTLPRGPNRLKNNSQQVSNQALSQPTASNALTNSEEDINCGGVEEDEETRRYREQIELQKMKREEVLRRKEQRRLLMAHERRRQMLQQQQQQQQPGQEVESMEETVDGLMPSPMEIEHTKPFLSTIDVKQRTANQDASAGVQNFSQSDNIKKRVVVIRRVVARPFANMRRPVGFVGSPIRTVTNAGSLLGLVPFSPDLQLEQKGMIQRLPSQETNDNVKARIPVASFSNNSNLTNITLQKPNKSQPQNPVGMRNVSRQSVQPLLQPGRPPQQLMRPPQQPGKPSQLPGQPNQQTERPVQQFGKQFQQSGRPQQQFRGAQQPPRGPLQNSGGLPLQARGLHQQGGGPQQRPRGPPQQSGRPVQSQPSNSINRPVARIVAAQADVNRTRQMSTTEAGVVNVSPDGKLKSTNSGISNRVAITSTTRAIPEGSTQPQARRIKVEMPTSTTPTQNATNVIQQAQQQVQSVNSTLKVQIENLAQATTDVQLRKLCQSIGPVETLNLFKDQRRALIKFKNVNHAKEFMDKYQRRMVDLSLIAISLVS